MNDRGFFPRGENIVVDTMLCVGAVQARYVSIAVSSIECLRERGNVRSEEEKNERTNERENERAANERKEKKKITLETSWSSPISSHNIALTSASSASARRFARALVAAFPARARQTLARR